MDDMPRSTPSPVLSLAGITKRFGPVTANQDIHLDVFPGQIHALLGENGAGKSTLMSILSGRYRPDSGTIELYGRPVEFSSPARSLEQGIGMVYQRYMLIESLSVVENIILGTTGLKYRLNLKQACNTIERLSRQFGLHVDPWKKIWQLSMGERQRVEILKLLYRKATILIFDEPTAILSPPEIDRFFETLKKLSASNHTIIFISHKLEEVLRIADRVTIMRRGQMIADLPVGQIESKAELARLMVGRDVFLNIDRRPLEYGRSVFQVTNLSATGTNHATPFDDITFDIKQGEIMAITGVAGNGQETLVAALTGRIPFTRGSITFGGKSHTGPEWLRADKQRLTYIPEDRHHAGSVSEASLVENFMLTRLKEFSRGPFLAFKKARNSTITAMDQFSIYAPAGPSTLARQLSGGNLQKLILARELDRHPELIIAEHPTQGLDIGATEDVWKALLGQRRHAGILLVSGDLSEVLTLADRIAIMYRGNILDTISSRNADEVSQIGLLMAGSRGDGRK
ncbi:MAG: ABC transporter ATP-binding protein [Desulfobacterales bacterium]|nr:ABC transporter ATP-binding protein [Desulfobacterales bacterium]MDD4393086.1 ABC transporter ATP-binding protein [Desulfobacterales bacterium]